MSALLHINSTIQWLQTLKATAATLPQTQRRKLSGINNIDQIVQRLEMVKAELQGHICDQPGCDRPAMVDDIFCAMHRKAENAVLPDWAVDIIDS